MMSYKTSWQESWQEPWQEPWQDVLADVLEDVVEDSCKLLQHGLVRFHLRSCKISEIFEPGCSLP